MRNFENWMNLTHPDPYSKDFEAALAASDLSELVETVIEICTDEARENPVMKLFRIKAICKGMQYKLDALFHDNDDEERTEPEQEEDKTELDMLREALRLVRELKTELTELE